MPIPQDVSTPHCAESVTYGSALYVVHALASLSIGATFHNVEVRGRARKSSMWPKLRLRNQSRQRHQPYRLCRGADLEPDARMATMPAMGRLAVEVTKLSSQPLS